MNKDVKITAEQLRQAVHSGMEKLLDEVTGAVNTAPEVAASNPAPAMQPGTQVLGRTPGTLFVSGSGRCSGGDSVLRLEFRLATLEELLP